MRNVHDNNDDNVTEHQHLKSEGKKQQRVLLRRYASYGTNLTHTLEVPNKYERCYSAPCQSDEKEEQDEEIRALNLFLDDALKFLEDDNQSSSECLKRRNAICETGKEERDRFSFI